MTPAGASTSLTSKINGMTTHTPGDGYGVGGGNGDVNNVDGDGAGTGTGVEANKRAQDGNEDGSGDGTGTGVETRGLTQDGNGDEIGEGGREAKTCKKPHMSCRRHVGNGRDLGGKRKERRQERVGPVSADPDNLENRKEAGGEGQGTQGLSKNCTSRESVSPLSPLSRLTRGFRNEYP